MKRQLQLMLCLAGLCAAAARAEGPAWWAERGAVDTNLPASDYALVTLGQLKWMATNAYLEMETWFGAGTGVAARVCGFSNSSNMDNYSFAAIGQVKYVVQPFYDRLYELNLTNTFPVGMPGYYPWGGTAVTNDYVLATIGQVKYAFSFDSGADTDGDDLADWREAGLGTSPYQFDTDGDGLSDGDEVNTYGTDPTKADTDGDGLSDGWEVANGKEPKDPDDAEPESSNLREMSRRLIVDHWRLYYGTPPAFTNTPGSAADLNDMKAALNALSGKFYAIQN